MNDSTTAVLTILVIGLLYLGANWIDKNSKFQNIIVEFSIGMWYTNNVERDRKLFPIGEEKMETINERLIDVLFEVRKRTVIIKCYNSINEEVYLCKGSGDDIASFSVLKFY